MSRIFKFVAGIFLCGLILIGGRASAADSMEIFRETLLQTSGQRNYIFQQDIFFVVPSAVGELDFVAGIERGKLNVAGEFGFWMTEPNGNLTEREVPFYLAQSDKDITVYFKADKKWEKMTSPINAEQFQNILNLSTQNLEAQIDMVKEVQILKDTDSKRILLVKIDGNKIADKIKTELAKNTPPAPNENFKEIQDKIFGIIDTGIRNADVWYTWSVNKTTWETVSVSANLSGLVQSIAQTALNDEAVQQFPEPFKEILENLAYFSEFKAYTSYLNPEAKSLLEIPKKVLKAKEVKSFSDDKKKK